MMKSRFIPALLIGAALALSGCVSGLGDGVSRDLAFDAPPPAVENIVIQDWDVTGVNVIVPRTLIVSEANTIKPRADIVWREDPIGDRHTQVDDLMTEALTPAFEAVTGTIPVVVQIELTRFHAQTQRVRYSNFNSEHEIEFIMTIVHAETGAILSGPDAFDLTFAALGGEDAVRADAEGVTQRMRITQRLQNWVRSEFIGTAAPSLLLASAG
ncbi:hypothetical protein HKCCE4037_19260 [Rhodobacterales bacterium HKCCE4037]|nr:hypothetical protein [Rhodobacterales bacterium HKCCE4037]